MNDLKSRLLASLVLGMASWGQSSAFVVSGYSCVSGYSGVSDYSCVSGYSCVFGSFISRNQLDSQDVRGGLVARGDDEVSSRKAATEQQASCKAAAEQQASRKAAAEQQASRKAAAEQLAKALDYFTSQKYHECLILLQPLDRQYRLNPRYRAYLGVCLYYEWEYAEAIKVFGAVLPLLKGLAPQELSLYYWMDAESHFMLQRYQDAVPLYGQMLPLCHDNERPDAYYRLGFCHLFLAEASAGQNEASAEVLEEKKKAKECFEQSLLGYLKYRNTPDEKARIAQIKHMIQGLK